jgi:glyoxylase-like metal-dependent hydrolase (beta-lactamase superfamily II)
MTPPRLPPPMRVFERGWLSSNSILFIGPDETALVDTGYVTHAAQTVALVRRAIAASPSPLPTPTRSRPGTRTR